MTERRAKLALVVALLALGGCGRPRAPVRERATPQPERKPAAVHEIEQTAMRFADPKGRWTLEVKADRVEAVTVHGPYDMTPASARYSEKDKPSVTMVAKHAHIDESARRVSFDGNVVIASPTWRLEAERVVYDLNSGKVEASGRTKWTLIGAPEAGAASSAREGKP
ncbi:MAG: LPS export ABC transporter periplasmic protein LptC [Armatimonadota bacterium]